MKRSLRKAHGTIWKLWALLIPAIIVAAIVVRQDPNDLAQPKLIEPAKGTTGSGNS